MHIRLEGVLDARTAARTIARVAEMGCDEVLLDIRKTWEVSDVALAFLAGGLARLPRSHIAFRGLRPHHVRLLQELGAGALIAQPDERG